MSQADTSLHAYALASQHLGKTQKAVLDAVRFFPDATNAEIGDYLNWPVNRVTPRMGELRKQGLVLEAGKRTCKVTGGSAHCWKAKHPVLPPAFEKKAEKPKAEQANSLF